MCLVDATDEINNAQGMVGFLKASIAEWGPGDLFISEINAHGLFKFLDAIYDSLDDASKNINEYRKKIGKEMPTDYLSF